MPVFAEKDYGPEQIALRYANYARGNSDGFVQAYHDILLSAPQAYGKIFRHLANTDPKPCLVNCTAGKDRTGVLIALLLSILNVPVDDIADEYALTDLGLAERKPIFVERLLQNPALNGNREGVQYMVSSRKENMDAALNMIDESFGGAECYVKQKCSLSDDDIGQIRKNLLAGGS